MSPEEAQHVIHQWVYFSAFQIANNHALLPDHHEVCVQSICDALFGPEWYSCTPEEQWAKKGTIGGEYNRMLTNYLPVLQQFLRDTNEIVRLDEATLSTLLTRASATKATATENTATKNTAKKTTIKKSDATRTSDAFNEPTVQNPAGGEETDDEILKTKSAIERDAAARKNLEKYYEPCQQGRKDLMIRRAKEPEGNIGEFNLKDIPLNDDKRTKNCPKCGKAITSNGIKRHYQITHEKDPRWVIYCPAFGCKFECWRGDATILEHMAYHHEDLHREAFGQKDVQKQADARQTARERVNARRAKRAEAQAKGSKSAISDGDKKRAEETELAEDHPRVKTPDFEDIQEEILYDEGMDDEGMDDEGMDDEGMDDEGMDDEVMQNRDMPNERMSIQSMLNPDMPGLYVPNQHMPNQHTPDQYLPGQYMSPSQYIPNHYTPNHYMLGQYNPPSQYIPNQYTPNHYMLGQYNPPAQYMSNQHMSNQHMSNQHMSNQHMSNQHMSNQHMSNQYIPNQFMPNEQMPHEQMPDEHLRLQDTGFDFTIGNAGDGHVYRFDQQH